eukprot:gene21848-biopygen12291
MGGGRRVAGQGLGIANVHQALEDLQRIVETHARLITTLQAEGQNRRRFALHVFLRQVMVGVIRQAGVADPLHQCVVLQEVGNLQGVFGVALHAQGQGFQALQQQECIHRRQGRAGVAQRHGTGAGNERRRAEFFGVDHTVIGRLRLVEAGEFLRVLGPGKGAAVDDHATQRVAVAAHVFGHRMHDDVRAELDRLAQDWRGHGVVHHQRHATGVGDVGQGFDIDDIACRVADALAVHQFGVVIDQLGDGFGAVVTGEAHVNAEARQQVGEQGVGATVQLRGGDDVVTGTGQGLDRVVDRRAAGRHRQGRDAAFECCDALLQHVVGGVHDARVDIAGHVEVEQVGAVLGVIEFESDVLVDRHGDGLGSRVRLEAMVQSDGGVFHELL